MVSKVLSNVTFTVVKAGPQTSVLDWDKISQITRLRCHRHNHSLTPFCVLFIVANYFLADYYAISKKVIASAFLRILHPTHDYDINIISCIKIDKSFGRNCTQAKAAKGGFHLQQSHLLLVYVWPYQLFHDRKASVSGFFCSNYQIISDLFWKSFFYG